MRLKLPIALAAIGLVLAACTASTSSTPDLVGTWVGNYSFALADGSARASTETLVITRQDGLLLWGYEEWQEDGRPMRDPLTGTVTDGGSGIVLTEPQGFYEGTVDEDTMTVVFTRVDATQHTAFEVTLTRQ